MHCHANSLRDFQTNLNRYMYCIEVLYSNRSNGAAIYK